MWIGLHIEPFVFGGAIYFFSQDGTICRVNEKVEKMFGGGRMTFHFLAETRIDFRDLVRGAREGVGDDGVVLVDAGCVWDARTALRRSVSESATNARSGSIQREPATNNPVAQASASAAEGITAVKDIRSPAGCPVRGSMTSARDESELSLKV